MGGVACLELLLLAATTDLFHYAQSFLPRSGGGNDSISIAHRSGLHGMAQSDRGCGALAGLRSKERTKSARAFPNPGVGRGSRFASGRNLSATRDRYVCLAGGKSHQSAIASEIGTGVGLQGHWEVEQIFDTLETNKPAARFSGLCLTSNGSLAIDYVIICRPDRKIVGLGRVMTGDGFRGYIANYSPQTAYQCHAAVNGWLDPQPLTRVGRDAVAAPERIWDHTFVRPDKTR